MHDDLKGILPAIVSPCDEQDRFLEDTFAAWSEHLYKQGVHGLYVCGGTGEGDKMLPAERKQAAEIAVDLSRKYEGKVIVHVGASNLRDTLDLAEHAADIGADAVSSMPPVRINQQQLVSFYTDIALASQIPLIVYYIPIFTGHNLTADEITELLRIEGVVGIKFSDYDLSLMHRIIQRQPDAIVYNGYDDMLALGLLYGASGGIGLTYNLLAPAYVAIYDAIQANDTARAIDLQSRCIKFVDALFRHAGVRENFESLMQHLGHAPYIWRRPRASTDGPKVQKFITEAKPILEEIEVAVAAAVLD